MLHAARKYIVVSALALTVCGGTALSAQNKADLVPLFGLDASAPPAKKRYLIELGDPTQQDVTTLVPNKPYQARAQVKNEGNATSSGGERCRFVLVDAANVPIPGVTVTPVDFAIGPLLTPNQLFDTVTVNITLPASVTAHTGAKLLFEIDLDNATDEGTTGGELNNTASRTVDIEPLQGDVGADLIEAPAKVLEGEVATFKVKVTNIGEIPVPARTADIWISRFDSEDTGITGTRKLGTIQIPALGTTNTTKTATESVDLTVLRPTPTTSTSTSLDDNEDCYFIVVLPNDDENNNNTKKTASSTYCEVFDYRISALTVSAAGTDSLGRTRFSISATTRNFGPGDCLRTSTTKIYYSNNSGNPETDPSAIEIGSFTITAKNNNQTQASSITNFAVPACASGSSIYFHAVCNAGKIDGEAPVSNNHSASGSQAIPALKLTKNFLEFGSTTATTKTVEIPTPNPPEPTPKVERVAFCLHLKSNSTSTTNPDPAQRIYIALLSGNSSGFAFDAFSSWSLGALSIQPIFGNWFGIVNKGVPAQMYFDANLLGDGNGNNALKGLTVYIHTALFDSGTLAYIPGFVGNQDGTGTSGQGLEMKFQ